MAPVIRNLDLPREQFERLLEGRQLDLEETPIDDLAALARYADATAGALAVLALHVLGAKTDATLAAGRAVGTAWALTGLLRAVPFHAAHRRLYLPMDRLSAHDVDPESIFVGSPTTGLAAVAREVAELAAGQLARARRQRTDRSGLPVLMLASLCGSYLRALEKVGYDPFAPAPTVSAGIGRLLWTSITGRY